MSTNDTSHIINTISILNLLKIVIDTLDRAIKQGSIKYYYDEQEMKNFFSEFIEFCDKQNKNNYQEKINFYYENKDDIKLKFLEKKIKLKMNII